MADDVAQGDGVAAAQPRGQAHDGADLRGAVEDLARAAPDLLDADRGVVEADRVAAHVVQGDELVDRPVLVDDEVRAHARAARAARRRARRGRRCRRPSRKVSAGRVVLDDDLRALQAEAVQAVVAAGVGAHLVAALGAEGDRALDDRAGARPWGRDAAGRGFGGASTSTSSPCRRPRCPRRPRGRAWRCARPRTPAGWRSRWPPAARSVGRRRSVAPAARGQADGEQRDGDRCRAAHGQKSSPTAGLPREARSLL